MGKPRMRWDLKGKFVFVIACGALALLGNIGVVYYETAQMNHNVDALELIEDIYNNILEMRRYEKNYLLFHDPESLGLADAYYQMVVQVLAKVPAERMTMRSGQEYPALARDLASYREILERLRHNPEDAEATNQIRAIGKQVVDIPEDLVKVERRRVSRAALSSSQWPLVSMGAMLLVFIGAATLISQKVIRPLAELEAATGKIAHGDFSPIPHSGHVDSQVDRLVKAFNKMAQELEARQEQVIHSRKIASLGTLVSGIAHELNNPINNIVLTIDTIIEGRNLSEERRQQLLDDILKQALRSSEIVKNLLDFSRAESAEIKEVDLAGLLRETLQLVGNQIAINKIAVHEDIAPDLPSIQGNRQGLQQVFLNLILNAIQAMPANGELTVSAGLDRNGDIQVLVKDTGEGIPEENLSAIFDPFFTTKEVGKGTGLGLSVSYGIVKKHGGQIRVASRLGKGTTFTVELPGPGGLARG